jgi:hypothetical protein
LKPVPTLFPPWANALPSITAAILGLTVAAIIAAAYIWGGWDNLKVGYRPVQPIEYSHQLHAGKLGIDCRYCHNTVERAAFAAIPPTQTCMNCHWKVKTDSAMLAPLRESWANDTPIAWVKVHKVPDYAYFNHAPHINAGVGCSSCHGRIDQMPRVMQVQPLNMRWCLDCHRDPAPYIRNPADVTKMDWEPDLSLSHSEPHAKNGRLLTPPLHCSGCHR